MTTRKINLDAQRKQLKMVNSQLNEIRIEKNYLINTPNKCYLVILNSIWESNHSKKLLWFDVEDNSYYYSNIYNNYCIIRGQDVYLNEILS